MTKYKSKNLKNKLLNQAFERNFKELLHGDKIVLNHKQKIQELLQEIKDLKEEIEMLKAINQEC